jgi:probable HAF family extracellular repeat protein
MARGPRALAAAALCAAFACATPALARAEALYAVKDLGTLGGSLSGALSINGRGEIVGHSFLAGDSTLRGFHDDGGGMRDLGTLGGPQSQARHVSEAGDVVGWASVSPSARHAFLWRGGALLDLGTLGGTWSDARWVNARGDVVGSSVAPGDLQERAFLWRDGALTDLGTLGGTDARAYCVNDLGDVVGFARIEGNEDLHAFLWRAGVMTDLGTLGGWASHAYAINNSGKVCGWSIKIPDYISHAFVWSDGTLLDLGTLGGVYSAAFALNAWGYVVGASTDAAGQQRAFVWDGGPRITDLNTLIAPESGWLLTSANAINDDGAIVGTGLHRGEVHAFLLIPISSLGVPPGAAALEPRFSGPWPNPARGRARFEVTLPRPGPVEVTVFDLTGRRVRGLARGGFPAGTTVIEWDARDEAGARVDAGVYFARFEGGARAFARRIVLVP